MKVIIAGSRDYLDPERVEEAVMWAPFEITEVVSGGARGIDTMAELWAKRQGIPVKRFPAAWRDRDGVLDRSAGAKRNAEMARYAEALIAIWDGESSGTKNMIKEAAKVGIPTYIQRSPL